MVYDREDYSVGVIDNDLTYFSHGSRLNNCSVVGSLTVGASRNATYTLSFPYTGYSYSIEFLSVTPLTNTLFRIELIRSGSTVFVGMSRGSILVTARHLPCLLLLTTHTVQLRIYNLDTSARTFNIVFNMSMIRGS